jgi:glycosyltransferase involved in cell wall biosynthesis
VSYQGKLKKGNIQLVHIYAGTGGSAGLYLHEIYCALEGKYDQEVFVNRYFPFNYGRKIFYRFSELSSPYRIIKKMVLLRHLIRFAELLLAQIYIMIYLIGNKSVKWVNYSLTSDLKIEYYFLIFIQRVLKRKVIITCHDVIPFVAKIEDEEVKQRSKKFFFDLADNLLVHNENSIKELISYFGINANKIHIFPFPIMDLKKLPEYGKYDDSLFKKDSHFFRVGMVGIFRKAKGLDILLSAWAKYYDPSEKSELLLAGKFIGDAPLNPETYSKMNVHIIDNYIDDKMYRAIIENCDLIVLPYSKGTNSGIPSSVLSLKTLLLTSDIEMFRNNKLINKNYLFSNQDSEMLASKLKWISDLTDEERKLLISQNSLILETYKHDFCYSVQNCFEMIMTNEDTLSTK